MPFHCIDREIEKGCNLEQRLIEHILEYHHATLEDREFYKTCHRSFDNILAHQHLHRVIASRIDDLQRSLNRFARSNPPTSDQVEGTVVGDAEEPGPKRCVLVQVGQRHERTNKRVLHDVLAIDDGPHQARTIAMQFRPNLGRQSKQLLRTRPVRLGGSGVQDCIPSRMVTPFSPLNPNAKPSANSGSSSADTTLFPKSRGGIGAPNRARKSLGSMPAAWA